MPRRKIKLAFISDELSRKVTYNKRKKCLIKKVTELTTLCDVPACAIISSPFDSQPEVWPNREGAMKVIERYQNSYMRDEKRNVNQERFTMQMVTKARDQLKKMKRDNREDELNLLMFVCMQNNSLSIDLNAEELKDFDKFVENKLKEVGCKIETLD
ncbi:agamous-like mads-box protein agl80-like [Trifolium pratense]|uniref:Agamous-like mads-box protein agl80-like n=1 Tax=Trifolium pratense TaxID=57577 RepID=A0A2K3KYI4_TRIPR|nr:agamous-like mads-box protein agl80-like [Trifolium pratense]